MNRGGKKNAKVDGMQTSRSSNTAKRGNDLHTWGTVAARTELTNQSSRRGLEGQGNRCRLASAFEACRDPQNLRCGT